MLYIFLSIGCVRLHRALFRSYVWLLDAQLPRMHLGLQLEVRCIIRALKKALAKFAACWSSASVFAWLLPGGCCGLLKRKGFLRFENQLKFNGLLALPRG